MALCTFTTHLCHDDVIKWKHLPCYWPCARGNQRSPVNSLAKASDTELCCFVWSALEPTVEQTMEPPVIWDAYYDVIVMPASVFDWSLFQVMVKLKDLTTGNEFMWDRNQFINRKYLMQEMYQNFMEGESIDVPQVSWVWFFTISNTAQRLSCPHTIKHVSTRRLECWATVSFLSFYPRPFWPSGIVLADGGLQYKDTFSSL